MSFSLVLHLVQRHATTVPDVILIPRTINVIQPDIGVALSDGQIYTISAEHRKEVMLVSDFIVSRFNLSPEAIVRL